MVEMGKEKFVVSSPEWASPCKIKEVLIDFVVLNYTHPVVFLCTLVYHLV